MNDCPFCIGVHTATATQASGNEVVVTAALADPETAPVEEGLRATLRMLGKLTRGGHLAAEDLRAVLDVGVSPQQVEDALAICYAFNVTNRLANAFGFQVASPPLHEFFSVVASLRACSPGLLALDLAHGPPYHNMCPRPPASRRAAPGVRLNQRMWVRRPGPSWREVQGE